MGAAASGPQTLLPADTTLARLLGGNMQAFASQLHAAGGEAVPAHAQILAPIDHQEVWAAGVTYGHSREARREESTLPDLYDFE